MREDIPRLDSLRDYHNTRATHVRAHYQHTGSNVATMRKPGQRHRAFATRCSARQSEDTIVQYAT